MFAVHWFEIYLQWRQSILRKQPVSLHLCITSSHLHIFNFVWENMAAKSVIQCFSEFVLYMCKYCINLLNKKHK